MIYEVQKFRSCDFGFEGLWIGFSGSWVLDRFHLWFSLSVLGYWIGFSSGSWALDRFWLQFLALDRFCFSSWVLDRLNIILLTNLIK
ncbi:unnamed protein product [Rhizophagus irregularis]|nr:unnamed protein product [Rhizophagus irregularis]